MQNLQTGRCLDHSDQFGLRGVPCYGNDYQKIHRFGQTVIAYDGHSAGAIAYREAAVEIIKRGERAATDEKERADG